MGHRSNNLLISLQYEGETELEFRIKYNNNNPEEQLCLYDLDCSYESKVAWNTSLTTLASTLDLAIEQPYDSYIEYECGIARGFDISNWPDEEYLPSIIGMRCNDVRQWIYEAPDPSDIANTLYVQADMPVCKCEFYHPSASQGRTFLIIHTSTIFIIIFYLFYL